MKTKKIVPKKSASLKKTLSGILTYKTVSGVKHANYNGKLSEIFLALLYLLKKHKNLSLIINNIQSDDEYHVMINHSLKWKYNFSKYEVLFPNNMDKYSYIRLLQTNTKRYGLNLLFIQLEKEEQSGHYNLIFYDFKKKTAERFEPMNQMMYEEKYNKVTDKFDKKMTKLLKGIGFRYIKPSSYIPFINLQDIEEDHDNLKNVKKSNLYNENRILKSDVEGYCGIWCIYYADLRLSFPKVKRAKLLIQIVYVLKDHNLKLRRFIRGYADNILKYLDKLEKQTKFNDLKFINDKYNPSYFKKVIYPLYNKLTQ